MLTKEEKEEGRKVGVCLKHIQLPHKIYQGWLFLCQEKALNVLFKIIEIQLNYNVVIISLQLNGSVIHT